MKQGGKRKLSALLFAKSDNRSECYDTNEYAVECEGDEEWGEEGENSRKGRVFSRDGITVPCCTH